jgi:hypothetical protein
MNTPEDVFLAIEKNNGFHRKTKKFFGRDGELGNEVESILGIKENNRTESDFPWLEVKTKLGKTKTTLFTVGRFSRGSNSKIHKGVKYNKNWKISQKYLYDNFGANYEFNTKTEKARIVLTEKSVCIQTIKQDIIYEITKQELEEVILLKFGKSVLLANCENVDEEYFRIKSATIYWGINLEKFYSLIQNNSIKICPRLGSNDYSRDHGTAFRLIDSCSFKDIYDYYERRTYTKPH